MRAMILPPFLRLLSLLALLLQPLHAQKNIVDQSTTIELASFNKSSPNFVVGGLFSLTSAGVVSEKGIHRAEAMRCAVDRYNKMALLPGKTIYYEIMDDGDDPIHSVYKTMNLINRGHMAVVGAGGSALTEADSKVLSSFNIPLISYASSAATLSDVSRYPTLLRTVASDAFQTAAMVSLANKFGWSLMGAVGTDDSYGSSGIAQFLVDARANSIRVPCTTIVSQRNAGAMASMADCLKRQQVKVVLVFANEQGAAAIIAGLYNFNSIPSDMIFIASDSWSTSLPPSLLKQSGIDPTILTGTISTIQWPGDLTPFKQCLGALTPQNNNYPLFITYWEKRFACIVNPPEGTAVCDPTKKGDGKCKCHGGETLAGDTPNNKAALVDDAVYAILNALHTLIHDCSSLPEALQAACTSPIITAKNILDVVRMSKFHGLSGEVAFNGVDRTSVSYSYIQYNGTAWNNIGSWVISGNATSKANAPVINLKEEALVWRPGYITAPVSVIRPDSVLPHDTIAILIKALASVGVVTTILFGAYFMRAHDHAVIKRASPLFCVLMLIGMLLIYLDLYLWDGEMNEARCAAKVWVPLIGFGFVMGPMLVKTFRIYKIFDSTRLRATARLQDSQLLGLSSIVVAGEVVLLTVWSAADPLRPMLIESTTSADLYTTIKCQGNYPDFQTGMYGAFVAYNAGLLALGVLMSYKARNVHSSFNESKYIAYAIYNISLCVAVLLPIYMTIGDGQGSSQRAYIVRSLATLFANTACMLLLFGPKFYQVYRDAKLEEYDSSGGGTDTVPRSGSQPGGGAGGQPQMNRRGSSGMMFANTNQGRGRQPSAGKGDQKKGAVNAPPSVKVMKSVKTPIQERDETSSREASQADKDKDLGV